MIREYKATNGVPRGSFYIEETLQFCDFETPEIKQITYHSTDKNELIELCKANNWACSDAKNADSWFTHEIKRRGIMSSNPPQISKFP
jgi:hypothetical protein